MDRREYLIKALQDPMEDIRAAAAKSLEQLEAKAGIEDLGMMILKGNKIEKLRAVYALGEIKNSRALSYLLKALNDPIEDVRASAIRVLGEVKDFRTINAVMERLNDSSKPVKLAAIEALGLFRDRRTVPSLLIQLDSNDKEIVERAVEALGRIGDKGAEASLIRLAEERGDQNIKVLVIKALGELEV